MVCFGEHNECNPLNSSPSFLPALVPPPLGPLSFDVSISPSFPWLFLHATLSYSLTKSPPQITASLRLAESLVCRASCDLKSASAGLLKTLSRVFGKCVYLANLSAVIESKQILSSLLSFFRSFCGSFFSFLSLFIFMSIILYYIPVRQSFLRSLRSFILSFPHSFFLPLVTSAGRARIQWRRCTQGKLKLISETLGGPDDIMG